MSKERHPTLPPDEPATARLPAGTTRFITRCLLVASHDPRYAALVPANGRCLFEQILRGAGDGNFVRLARSRVFRAAFRAFAGFLLPGIIPHYLARKRCLEDWARRACDSTYESTRPGAQIVVLGAGLDTLAWQLHTQFPAIRFTELDRPPALQIKEAALAGGSGGPHRNLIFLPCDLGSETLAAALERSPGFTPGEPALFVGEGLLMYLPPDRVQALFAEIAALATPAYFAFTFMEARQDGHIRFRRSNPLVDWWLRRGGEPFRWSQDPEKLPALLASMGWRLDELVSGQTLRSHYLAPAGLGEATLAIGEWLAFAQTGERP